MREELDGLDVDLTRLPPDLRTLVPLIRQWAAGDDEERARRLAAASTGELQKLRDGPQELWDSINAYLDENIQGPEPYEAIVLDGFAQAAMEADAELDERGAG